MAQKRTRDGHQKTTHPMTTDTGLTAAARLAGTTTNDDAFQNMMQTLQSNMTTISTMETTFNNQTTMNTNVDKAIKVLETNVSNHGALLQTLTNTQASQGRLLNTLNTHVSKLCKAILNYTDVEMEDAESGPNNFRSARNKYIYSRENLSATIRYELCGFQGVQAQVYDTTIITDGFEDRSHTLFSKLQTN